MSAFANFYSNLSYSPSHFGKTLTLSSLTCVEVYLPVLINAYCPIMLKVEYKRI